MVTMYGVGVSISFVFYYSDRTDERLPDIMWCCEPFMEVLNEIND